MIDVARAARVRRALAAAADARATAEPCPVGQLADIRDLLGSPPLPEGFGESWAEYAGRAAYSAVQAERGRRGAQAARVSRMFRQAEARRDAGMSGRSER